MLRWGLGKEVHGLFTRLSIISMAGLVAVGFLSSPLCAADPAAGKFDEIIAAAHKNFPPYYMADEDDNPQGFAIEVMNAVAKRAQLKLTYRYFKRGKDML
jgi:ABC-type amino acid transport substrate-binding protein